MIIVDVNHFDYKKAAKIKNQARKRGNPATKRIRYYRDIVCAFDIETTNLPEDGLSFMYVWQFQFGDICTVIGRTCRVSCLNPRKPSRDLLQDVSRPDSPTMAREQ